MNPTLTVSVAVIMALALAATGAMATDRSFSVNGVTLSVEGQSGGIKLYSSADSQNFIQIKQSKLEEFDSNGNNLSSHSVNLASTDANWSPLQSVTQANGVVYSWTQYTSTFRIGNANSTVFTLLARLYSNSTTVMTGDTQLTVVANSVKFDVNVTGWPFAASTNTLQWAVEVSSKGSNGGRDGNTRGTNTRSVAFDNGLMSYPLTAVVDGNANTAITASLQAKGNGQTQVITFGFPSAQRTIAYDPVLCLGCPDTSAAVMRVSGSAAASLTALVLAAVVSLALKHN